MKINYKPNDVPSSDLRLTLKTETPFKIETWTLCVITFIPPFKDRATVAEII